MPDLALAARVENLEKRLASIEALPARVSAVELQIQQLRTEMGQHFSAIRQEFAAGDFGLRDEMRTYAVARRNQDGRRADSRGAAGGNS